MEKEQEPSTSSVSLRDVPDELWRMARIQAITEGRTVTALVVAAIEEYLGRHA
jgi:hypothetical protein